ncbi:cytochrome P450 [Streptomyces hebeiensis]
MTRTAKPSPWPSLPSPRTGTSHARARRRDRRVYLAAHPLLFGLLAVDRRRPVGKVGGTVLVHGAEAYREALTRLPLDRTAAGTTGGAARAALGDSRGPAASRGTDDGGVLFDQEGGGHRAARRDLAGRLGAEGVARLRAVWRPALDAATARLDRGHEVDLVDLARALSGSVVCALLDRDADPLEVADAALDAASAAVRGHLPGPRRRSAATAARAATRLRRLLATDSALDTMVAVATVTTTVAALPRAVAWCADAGLWAQAEHATSRPGRAPGPGSGLAPVLADELLRVLAPSPVLPRVAAADGSVGGCPVRAGDRLVLVARHAADAHRRDPDAGRPADASLAHLVFGAGPHTCPGARAARTQLADVLTALAPFRPTVVRARADRRAALPSWRSLTIRATRPAAAPGPVRASGPVRAREPDGTRPPVPRTPPRVPVPAPGPARTTASTARPSPTGASPSAPAARAMDPARAEVPNRATAPGPGRPTAGPRP